ncbi:hypothetical protein [Burkholderia singularis]|uniref:hypothetical protein n=1 Tax=Burkholderia singularis TaxID=1503053 RepID=UPI000F7A2D53|nr:hypothetical protein [Burkholderia singularis]
MQLSLPTGNWPPAAFCSESSEYFFDKNSEISQCIFKSMPAFGSGNERHIDKKYPALEKQSLISNPRKNRTYAPIIRRVAYRCESRHAVDTAAHVVETGASAGVRRGRRHRGPRPDNGALAALNALSVRSGATLERERRPIKVLPPSPSNASTPPLFSRPSFITG